MAAEAQDKDKPKLTVPPNQQKSKGNKPQTLRKRVHQGRWRTVVTKKVPPKELTQETDNAEHRPLGL